MDIDLPRYHRQMLLPGFGQEGQQRLACLLYTSDAADE